MEKNFTPQEDFVSQAERDEIDFLSMYIITDSEAGKSLAEKQDKDLMPIIYLIWRVRQQDKDNELYDPLYDAVNARLKQIFEKNGAVFGTSIFDVVNELDIAEYDYKNKAGYLQNLSPGKKATLERLIKVYHKLDPRRYRTFYKALIYQEELDKTQQYLQEKGTVCIPVNESALQKKIDEEYITYLYNSNIYHLSKTPEEFGVLLQNVEKYRLLPGKEKDYDDLYKFLVKMTITGPSVSIPQKKPMPSPEEPNLPTKKRRIQRKIEEPISKKVAYHEKKCLTEQLIKEVGLCSFEPGLQYDFFQKGKFVSKLVRNPVCIRKIDNNHLFVQLKTINQFILANRLKVEPAFCGGATYRNGLLMSEYNKTQNIQKLRDINDAHKAQIFLQKIGLAQWNSAQDVRNYLAKAQQEGLDTHNISVLENVVMLDETVKEKYPNYALYALDEGECKEAEKILNAMRKGMRQPNFFQILLMSSADMVSPGERAHFFCIALCKDADSIQYIVLDTTLAYHLDPESHQYKRLVYLMNLIETGKDTSQFVETNTTIPVQNANPPF